MVARAPVHQRMRPAGIVPEHAAQAAAVAGRCFRTEQQAVRLQRQVQFVPHDAGLNPRPALFRIDFQDFVPTLDVHDDTLSHNLSGERSARRPGNQMRLPPARLPEQLPDIVGTFRKRDAYRHLPVGGRIGSVRHPVQRVGVDLTGHVQEKMMVLFLKVSILRSMCLETARERTIFSRSFPFRTRLSGVSLWVMRATSCSMIGPASRSAVT